jgi:hypothetical protein
VLRRFLRHLWAAFCAAYQSPLKMVVGHLKVMRSGDLRTVADPGTDNVRREGLFEFCLTARPQIVKDAWPGFQTGALDDPSHLCP